MELLCLFLALLSPSFAFATPNRIILMRHAEKPADDKAPDLSERGHERAAALPKLFASNAVLLQKPKPDFIFAMSPPVAAHGKSQRAVETVEPLAKSLGLEINKSYWHVDIEAMVREVLEDSAYDGKVILICWNHDQITEIAQDLGWKRAPEWPGNIFDRFWVLDYSGNDLRAEQNLPEHLLSGDSEK